MITTGILIVLLIAALVMIIKNPKIVTNEGNLRYEKTYNLRWYGVIPLVLFIALGIFSCTTVVDAKTEGVLLTFKKPSERVLPSGLHLKAPWQSVVEIDGTQKTDNFNNGQENAEDDPVQDHADIDCRLGDNGTATVKASIEWQVAEGSSNRVYERYRSDDPAEKMRESLVVPRFRDAINQVCGTYMPTLAIDNLNIDYSKPEQAAEAIKNLNLAPDFRGLSADLDEAVKELLGYSGDEVDDSLVEVLHVSISYLKLPDSSQNKIDQFLAEANKTRVALQSQATNTAQAEANRILADSISNDPYVLVSKCLDLIADGDLELPAGGSCWPGGGGGVVIPSAPTP